MHALFSFVTCAGLVCAGLAGCGVQQGGSAASASGAAPVDERSAANRDVDLVVAQAVATPRGPTTSENITLRLTFANLGEGYTPYGFLQGTLSYTPIVYTVTRDGEVVASGSIGGLTGHDQVVRDVALTHQAAGDKVYVITIDSAQDIAEHDESNNTATITVLYGGSG